MGDRDGFERVFPRVPPDGIGATQIQWYQALAGRGYKATGSTPKPRFELMKRELQGGATLRLRSDHPSR